MSSIKITLVRSKIGAIPKHKKTIEALGLRKTNSFVVREDSPSVRGMVNQISHLVKVTEC